MLLPSLVDLAGKWIITFLGRQPGISFISDFVNRAIDIEGSGWHRLFLKKPAPEGLPVSETDLVVAFFNDEEGIIQDNLTAYLPNTPIHLFPSFPREGKKMHMVHYFSNCLKQAGLPIDPLAVFENARKRPVIIRRGIPLVRGKLVVHPGSGAIRKNYPPQFWLKLLSRLDCDPDFKKMRLALLLGPAEESLYCFFQENLVDTNGEIHLCADNDTLTNLLEQACLYLGHDSGITHFAAMLGVPTIALFRERNESRWRPLGPSVRVVMKKKPGPSLVREVLELARDLHRSTPCLPFAL